MDAARADDLAIRRFSGRHAGVRRRIGAGCILATLRVDDPGFGADRHQSIGYLTDEAREGGTVGIRLVRGRSRRGRDRMVSCAGAGGSLLLAFRGPGAGNLWDDAGIYGDEHNSGPQSGLSKAQSAADTVD